MAREYELKDTAVLYNGAQDTDGGIWLRIRDENDRRILHAAIDKQLKNQQAATGTLTALDPNAGHLVDYVADALNRVKESVVGARPASSQLDGTPMGQAIRGESGTPPASGSSSTAASTDGKGKRGRKGKGEPETVGSIAQRTSTAASSSTETPEIQWAASVPEPRPRKGDTLRTPAGYASTVEKVIGYDSGANAFRIIDSDGWDGLVFAHSGGWRLLTQALEYTDNPDVEGTQASAASSTPVEDANAMEEFPGALTEDDDAGQPTAGEVATAAESGSERAATAPAPRKRAPAAKKSAGTTGKGASKPAAKKAAGGTGKPRRGK